MPVSSFCTGPYDFPRDVIPDLSVLQRDWIDSISIMKIWLSYLKKLLCSTSRRLANPCSILIHFPLITMLLFFFLIKICILLWWRNIPIISLVLFSSFSIGDSNILTSSVYKLLSCLCVRKHQKMKLWAWSRDPPVRAGNSIASCTQ